MSNMCWDLDALGFFHVVCVWVEEDDVLFWKKELVSFSSRDAIRLRRDVSFLLRFSIPCGPRVPLWILPSLLLVPTFALMSCPIRMLRSFGIAPRVVADDGDRKPGILGLHPRAERDHNDGKISWYGDEHCTDRLRFYFEFHSIMQHKWSGRRPTMPRILLRSTAYGTSTPHTCGLARAYYYAPLHTSTPRYIALGLLHSLHTNTLFCVLVCTAPCQIGVHVNGMVYVGPQIGMNPKPILGLPDLEY